MLSMFFKKLLLSREANIDNGEIRLFGNNFYMQPVDELVHLHKNLSKNFGEKGLDILYESGKMSSKELFKNMERFVVKKSDMIKLFLNMLNLYGFGEVEIRNIREKKEVSLAVKNNSFAKSYFKLRGRQKSPVDNLLAGLFAGFFSELWKKNFNCKEVACIAQAKVHCQFEVK